MFKKFLLLLTLFTSLSFGGISKIQTKLAFSTSSVASQAVTLDSTPAVGDIIIIGVATSTSNNEVVTDNQGNPYASMRRFHQSSTSASIWCGVATVSSGTFTVTATPQASTFVTVMAIEYSGATCDLDKSGAAGGATSPYSCGSFTTLNANDLLLSSLNNDGAGTITYTAPSGFTTQVSQTSGSTGEGGAIADDIVSSTGSFTPTWTISTNASTTCVFIALKASVAASTGGGSFVVPQ